MLLVDSAVWIDHLRLADADLQMQLDAQGVVGHPLVTGEVAMGSLADRRAVLTLLQQLPQAVRAEDSEVLTLVEQRMLFSLGLGFVDAHLLASCLLTPATRLLTRDRRLHGAAERLGVAAYIPTEP
ncbi:MAG TPA: VapC toxin family PIN domain ribonuclease [Allosphingosinicella sp.]|nr:VapC toxin family PIN domain ribonuclease [Allosphingosinicella sp.]